MPAAVTAAAAMDYAANGGRLVKVTGEVSDVVLSNGVVSSFMVDDGSGAKARIFIDGYITPAVAIESFVTNGAYISAVGLVYANPDGINIRVRDRAEIKTETDKRDLAAKISAALLLEKEDYTLGSWKRLERALTAAQAVFADGTASQDQANCAAARLQYEMDRLQRLPPQYYFPIPHRLFFAYCVRFYLTMNIWNKHG